MTNNAKEKGDFLEKLVGFLHEITGEQVTRNVRLPAIDESGRRREIDVLLSATSEELGDCPVDIPIECKNYGESIGVEHIDAFFGKLHDIGIPTNLGVFVAASGYTTDALVRAKAAGIKTLVAEGLTKDRLALEIRRALHSVVFWVAAWRDTSHFPFVPGGSGPEGSIEAELPQGTSWITGKFDVMWRLWLAGTIPCELGEHVVFINIGPTEKAICTVDVSAHGANIPGQIESTSLTQAQTGEIEKAYAQSQVDIPPIAIGLHQFKDNPEIEEAASRADIRMDVRAPRIIGPQMYWPPTNETRNRIIQLKRSGEAPTFERLEGPNILRAWAVSKNPTQ